MEGKSFLQTHHPVNKYLGCSSLLRHYKHYVFPGLNVATEELLEDGISAETASQCYKSPLLNVGRPIPCLDPKHIDALDNPKEDPVMVLVRKKYFWQRKKKQLQMTVDRLTSRPVLFPNLIKIINEREEPITKLPYAVVRMSDHLANNPDKFFKGVYHWYYGNAMKELTINNERYLLYANKKDLNELCMTLIKKSKNSAIPTLIPQVSISLPESDFIYDITADDCNRTIAVRQRKSCLFLNYYEDCDGNVGFKNFLTLKSSEYPYVALDNCNSEFTTIDANRHVQFWNPEYLTWKYCVEHTNLPKNDSKLSDRFTQIKYDSNHSSQIFVVIDRHNVYIYDKRAGYKDPCFHVKPDKQTEECEQMSVLIPSVREKTWYIGMSHSCLLLDTRMGFAEKWTHMMSQHPSVGQSLRLNKESHVLKEAVILSTQTTNEVVALYNSDQEPRETYLPVGIPTRQDTFHEAHVNGVLTNLHLRNKFNYSLIGLTTYKSKKRMGIFSLISTGDIFYQCMNPSEGTFDKNITSLNEVELKYLEDWEHKFCMKNMNQKRILTVSRSVDFSDLVGSIDESVEIPPWETHAPPRKAHWKVTPKNLRTYKDLLVPYILNDYGVDDIDDWSTDEAEQDSIFDNAEKIENWLSGNQCNSQPNCSPEIFVDSAENVNDANTMLVTSNSQEEDASITDPVVELDVKVPPQFDLELLSKPKTKRKRRR